MAFFNSLLGENIYINLQVGVLVITNIFIAGEIIMLLSATRVCLRLVLHPW